MSKRENNPFFDPIELGAYNQTRNLSIEARFSECGEWGGHSEKIVIYSDPSMNIHARYQVFPFNCDSLKYYYGNDNIHPTIDKSLMLNDNAKKSITDYLLRLMESKIAERFPGHAGNYFSVIKPDSTLIIQVYDRKEIDVNSFRKLVDDLFLKI